MASLRTRGLRPIVTRSGKEISRLRLSIIADPSSCRSRQHRIRRKFACIETTRPSSPLFARCRLAGIVYNAPPLRAAVKFSTLQSYEFVAANAIIIATATSSSHRPLLLLLFFFFCTVCLVLFPCFARSRTLRRRRPV